MGLSDQESLGGGAGTASGDDSWIEEGPTASGSIAGSPTWLLIVAAIGLAISAVALAGGVVLQILGYVTASLLSFTMVALFRRHSVERSARLGIGTSRTLNMVALAFLVIGFALSLVHAWNIASYFS